MWWRMRRRGPSDKPRVALSFTREGSALRLRRQQQQHSSPVGT